MEENKRGRRIVQRPNAIEIDGIEHKLPKHVQTGSNSVTFTKGGGIEVNGYGLDPETGEFAPVADSKEPVPFWRAVLDATLDLGVRVAAVVIILWLVRYLLFRGLAVG